MSDSSLSSVAPSNAMLEQALRNAVQGLFKAGNFEELTIKRVRVAAERYLDLEDGFFKNDPTWKEESKRIIQAEVEAHKESESIGDPSNSQASSQPKIFSAPTKPQQANTLKTDATQSYATATQSKKRKKETNEQTSEIENSRVKAKRSFQKSGKSTVKSSTSSLLDQEEDRDPDPKPPLNGKSTNEAPDLESESEMSVVIDEKPKRKSKTRESGSGKSRSSKTARPRASKKADEKPVDADADEIKRLQGWLVKCGIRKMWYKELAPYHSPKMKIQHLKTMLSDAGMTGRYSMEKATHIRNERELKADLEAVQEGDKQWGKSESDDEAPAKPRRRKLARGLQELDVLLNGSDGAETD